MYGLAIEPTFSPIPDARVSPLTKSSSSSPSSKSSLISPIVKLGLGVSYNAAAAAEVEGMAVSRLQNVAMAEAVAAAASVSFSFSSRQFRYERRRRMRVLVRLSLENLRSPSYAPYVLYRPFHIFTKFNPSVVGVLFFFFAFSRLLFLRQRRRM